MHLRMKLIICIAAAAAAVTAVNAQTTTYEFLRNDMGARAASMGGSMVSVIGDPASAFYNPATLATVKDNQGQFGYGSYLLGINEGYASYNQPVDGVGMMAASARYFSYGTMDETDSKGTTLGTFGAHDMALAVSMGRELEENLYYGATAKFIYSTIADYTSTGLAADFGLLYLIPGDNPITLGASVTNLGTQLSTYAGTKESLPTEVAVGATVKPQHLPMLLSFNFHRLADKEASFGDHFKQFTLGAELQLGKAVRFRVGYVNETRTDLKIETSSGMAGFSFGGGLVLEKMRFDYGYSSFGKIGSINRITVGLLI